jgi:hypothetical protein
LTTTWAPVGREMRSYVSSSLSTPSTQSQQLHTRLVAAIEGLAIEVDWDLDQWVATDPVTGGFGEGDTPTRAVADLLQRLRALREALRADHDKLDPRLASHLAHLERSLSR